jgi:hypothetical protein
MHRQDALIVGGAPGHEQVASDDRFLGRADR